MSNLQKAENLFQWKDKNESTFNITVLHYEIQVWHKSHYLTVSSNKVITGERCKVVDDAEARQIQPIGIKETNIREVVMLLLGMKKVLSIWQHEILSCYLQALCKNTEYREWYPFYSNRDILRYISFPSCQKHRVSLDLKLLKLLEDFFLQKVLEKRSLNDFMHACI